METRILNGCLGMEEFRESSSMSERDVMNMIISFCRCFKDVILNSDSCDSNTCWLILFFFFFLIRLTLSIHSVVNFIFIMLAP